MLLTPTKVGDREMKEAGGASSDGSHDALPVQVEQFSGRPWIPAKFVMLHPVIALRAVLWREGIVEGRGEAHTSWSTFLACSPDRLQSLHSTYTYHPCNSSDSHRNTLPRFQEYLIPSPCAFMWNDWKPAWRWLWATCCRWHCLQRSGLDYRVSTGASQPQLFCASAGKEIPVVLALRKWAVW